MLRSDDLVKGQIVLTAWRYAQLYGQGGHLCPELIMGCLAERQRKGWGSWFEILERVPSFAAENNPPELVYPPLWEPSVMRLLHSVESIYDGTSNPSKGGLYWADLRRIETPFFKKILENPEEHPRVVDMNSFVIFK